MFEIPISGDASTPAPAATPADSEVVENPTGDSTPTPPADAGTTQTEQPVIADPNGQQGDGTNDQPGAETPNDDDAEEKALRELAENPLTPKFAREKIQEAMAYAGKLKEKFTATQQEFDNFRNQYEGKESLPQPELDRLKASDESIYKLSSLTAEPTEILTTLRDIVGDNKLKAVKNDLVWEFLRTPEGSPDLENLQVVIDSFTGYKDGETRVQAKDVMTAIDSIKRGILEPYQLHEFGTDAEREAAEKARAVEAEAERVKQIAIQNAQYQERNARTQVLQGVVRQVQDMFQPQVTTLLDKFQLNPIEGEPKLATEFKQSVQERIAGIVNAARENRYIGDIYKAVQLLGEPTGADPQTIEREIGSYASSPAFQGTLNRGISELVSSIEKVVTQEAYRYKLMMMGYEAEVSKGQKAREVLGTPPASAGMSEKSAEELSKMSARERNDYFLTQASNALRKQSQPNRYGG